MTTAPVFTAHDVGDLFNLLPTVFGFMPEESICAIATSGPRERFGFRMRVDLPHDAEHVPQLARFVAGHLRNNGAEGAIVLVVSRRREAAGEAAWAVERALGTVRPVVTAWTDTQRYWTTFDDDPREGTPLELSDHHPGVVSAVVAGQEILPDRATLERRWHPAEGPRCGWLASQVLEVERDIVRQSWTRSGTQVGDVGIEEVLQVVGLLEGGARPDDLALLRSCVWLTHHAVRDRVWPLYSREEAERILPAWRELARQAPSAYAAVPYTVAAYLAYLVGDGAQAMMGLERARAADPCFDMAECLQRALVAGLHPDQLHRLVSGVALAELAEATRPGADAT